MSAERSEESSGHRDGMRGSQNSMQAHGSDSNTVLARLRALRKLDAPTHGGKVLAYVYDSGRAELDDLANEAANIARPLNGLDPTTFRSIAVMEADLVAFVRRALNGERQRFGGRIVGSVTSGGTESCLLAVKTARDLWRRAHPLSTVRPRLVAPVTAHAAFQKAARLFDLEWSPVPCLPDGTVRATEIIRHLDANNADDVALVVVSAPAYPSGAVDPIHTVSDAALARGISCHVDACFGGFALPWWPGVPKWDFRLPGVTSMSADLHKFGYAPKGTSVLLHRGRLRHRAQFFATTRWPAYPVVNPTLLGSRSASPLAAAWAITQRLGAVGYRDLTSACVRATAGLVQTVDGIRGLTVQGDPIGPAISLIADESVLPAKRVDPHHLADEVARRGFKIQHQPGLIQPNGVHMPHSAHLTITPVTEQALPELSRALIDAADAVRGRPRATARASLKAMRLLGYGQGGRVPGPTAARAILRIAGAAPNARDGLPSEMASLMALIEGMPAPVAEALLAELLAWACEPGR